uniref:Uncharacterized protein n=1 Tax=Arundo donax TaxID=35708 RepID=A0A0A9A7I0_ARUDO
MGNTRYKQSPVKN